MERNELIEWIIIIGCVVLWWPRLLGFNPTWYHIVLYYVEPVVLLVILARRFRRMRQGLDYSEQTMKSQIPGRPPVDETDRH